MTDRRPRPNEGSRDDTAITPDRSTHAFGGIGDTNQLNPIFARAGEATDFPLDRLPDSESLPETAYQVVHDESMLDGNARLNLATFVANGSIHVPTKVGRLSRALPSSIDSSCTPW